MTAADETPGMRSMRLGERDRRQLRRSPGFTDCSGRREGRGGQYIDIQYPSIHQYIHISSIQMSRYHRYINLSVNIYILSMYINVRSMRLGERERREP